MFKVLREKIRAQRKRAETRRFAIEAKDDPQKSLKDSLYYRQIGFFYYLLSDLSDQLDVNFIYQGSGLRPIQLACSNASVDEVQALLDLGADLQFKPRYASDALLKSVLKNEEHNRQPIWDLLLNSIPIDQPIQDGRTLLSYVAMTGNISDAQFLLERGADPTANMKETSPIWGHPLLFALMCNEDKSLFEILLEHSLAAISDKSLSKDTLVSQVFNDVCGYGYGGGEYPVSKRLEDLGFLYRQGADCEYLDQRGFEHRPFQRLEPMEFSSKFEETLELFCQMGLDINGPSQEKGKYILEILDKGFHPKADFVKYLKTYGADFNQIVEGFGRSEPLWFSILGAGSYYAESWVPLAMALKEAGANLNALDSDGNYFVERLPWKRDQGLEQLNTLVSLGLNEKAVEQYFEVKKKYYP